MNSSASAARGTSDLTPSSTKPPPARRARVRSSNGLNSGRGSSIASAAAGTFSPTNSGRYVACWSASPHRLSAVETPAGARHATAIPMSPCASASAISTVVTAERSRDGAAELLGHADHRQPELVRLGEQLARGGARVVGGLGRGAELREREVAHRFAQHLLLVVGREVEQVAAPAPRLASRPRQLLGGGERAAGARGGSHGRLRGAVEDALRGVPQAEAIDQRVAARRFSARSPTAIPRSVRFCSAMIRSAPSCSRGR